jgi:hypothetical protein
MSFKTDVNLHVVSILTFKNLENTFIYFILLATEERLGFELDPDP